MWHFFFLGRNEHIMKSHQVEQGVAIPKVQKPLALAGKLYYDLKIGTDIKEKKRKEK